MAGLKVLTFNFHEPYLWLMSKTGFDFTIGLYTKPPLARDWHTHYRPIPKNMRIVEESAWRADLEAGKFDVVVAHNENNAIDVFKSPVPKILLCHNRKTFLKTTVTPDKQDAYEALLARLREQFSFVFISESKRDDYGIPGEVILPGIDVDEFGGYTGEAAEVLRVGNMMRARNLMFDVDLQECVCRGLPNRMAGFDPAISGASEADSFEDLIALYRSRRCLLHVTRQEYEDGYNLSTLEAMACGMPVVALANATSPFTDGVDGLVGADAAGLRERVERLMGDAESARKIGERGRETVASKFPISEFVANWRRVIETAAESRARTPKAFDVGGYYRNDRREIAQVVPLTAERVLDVGCGAGEFGRLLKQQGVSHVYGIELFEDAWAMAKTVLDDAICGNIEVMDLPFPDGHFDCITFNDVVEHLVYPAEALRKASRCLAPHGVIIMSVPNVRFFQVVAMLAMGRWTYESAGILDRTHLRFFTAYEMRGLVESAGLELLELVPLAQATEAMLPRNKDGSVTLGTMTIKPFSDRDYDDLRTYQYLVIAGIPGGDRLAKVRALLDAGYHKAAYHAALQARGVDVAECARVAGAAAVAMGEFQEAERVYREALKITDSPRVAGELGVLLSAQNRAGEARQYLERAAAEAGASPDARAALARIYLEDGAKSQALALLAGAMEEDFQYQDQVFPLIEAAEELGRFDDIESVVTRYADFYPGHVDIALALVGMLLKMGRKDDARARLAGSMAFALGLPAARELMERIEQS